MTTPHDPTTLARPCQVNIRSDLTGRQLQGRLTSHPDSHYPYLVKTPEGTVTFTAAGREFIDRDRKGWYIVGPVLPERQAPDPLIFGTSMVGCEPIIRPPTLPLQEGDVVELDGGIRATVLFLDCDQDAIIRYTTSEGDHVGVVRSSDGLFYDLETDDATTDRVQLVARKAQA